jgi:hypothetical protein
MKRTSFGHGVAGILAGSFLGMLCLDCSSPGQVGDNNSASASGGAAGVIIDPTVGQGGASGSGAGPGGGTGTAGTTGSAEGTCGETTITPNRAPTDIFIVLDRSGSMSYSISDDCYCNGSNGGNGSRCPNTTNCTDRLTAVKGAVEQTINANPTINWGLEFYSAPAGADCSVSLVPDVPISTTAGPTVIAQVSSMTAANHTPTAAAINAASMYVQTVNDGNSKAILLATDGMPNCVGGRVNTDDDMPATTAAVAGAYRAGIPVYVVGMGPQQSITNLNELAVAGGTGQYYPADSAQALSDALAAISKIVSTTCEFQTPQSPPDDSKVYVYVDKVLINQAASPTDDGWVFGATSSDIVLTGSYCTNLLAGAASTVQIIFGCKDYIPPEIIP